MATSGAEKLLTSVLSYYLSLDDNLNQPNAATRRKTSVKDLQVMIHSNGHNPPHFYIKSEQRKINARFKIENCELIDGEISANDLKKVNAFYLGPNGKLILTGISNLGL